MCKESIWALFLMGEEEPTLGTTQEHRFIAAFHCTFVPLSFLFTF